MLGEISVLLLSVDFDIDLFVSIDLVIVLYWNYVSWKILPWNDFLLTMRHYMFLTSLSLAPCPHRSCLPTQHAFKQIFSSLAQTKLWSVFPCHVSFWHHLPHFFSKRNTEWALFDMLPITIKERGGEKWQKPWKRKMDPGAVNVLTPPFL